jgi:hypothetical protein
MNEKLNSVNAELANIINNNINNYTFAVFNPNVADVKSTPNSCRIPVDNKNDDDNKSKHIPNMDTIPNMTRIGGTNLYTPDACKMEAAISSAQYYSLVENTINDSKNKLFKCYTYSGDLTPSIIIPDTDVTSGYMVNVVHVLLGKVISGNTVAPPITSATINSEGSFMINGTTPLFTMTLLPTLSNTLADSYYSKYGNIILGWVNENRPEMLNGCSNSYQAMMHYNEVGKNTGLTPFSSVDLVLDYDTNGKNITLKMNRMLSKTIYDTAVLFSYIVPETAVKNYNWKLNCNNTLLNKISITDSMFNTANTQIAVEQPLISSDHRFKLKIKNDLTNIILLYCKNPCPSDKDTVKYTTDDARYLNSVSVPQQFNNIYYNKKSEKTLQRIPTNAPILSYDNRLYPNTPDVVSYSGYAPSSLDNAYTPKENCKADCINNNCDYYYEYKTNDGKTFCNSGNNTTTTIVPPGLFNPVEQYPNISKSTLTIRNKKIDVKGNVMLSSGIVPMDYSPQYGDYNGYTVEEFNVGDGLGVLSQVDYQTVLTTQKTIMDGYLKQEQAAQELLKNTPTMQTSDITLTVSTPEPVTDVIPTTLSGTKYDAMLKNEIESASAAAASVASTPDTPVATSSTAATVKNSKSASEISYINRVINHLRRRLNHFKSQLSDALKRHNPRQIHYFKKRVNKTQDLITQKEQSIKQGFQSKISYSEVEPFNSYNPAQCGITENGCADDITKNKIGPLNTALSGLQTNTMKVGSNYIDIGNNINNYNALHKKLSNNSKKYEFNEYDANTDIYKTNILQKTPSIIDAANDDINEMIMQQNNMYILGTVASATLIITAILLSSSD